MTLRCVDTASTVARMPGRAVDDDKLEDLTERVFGVLAGAMTAGMINLGDRLGLYRALAAEPPMTSEELARKAGLHERWVREWVQGQATAGLVDYVGQGRFTL